MNFCTAIGCAREVLAKGLCGMHYQRRAKFGDENHFIPKTREERFWPRVAKSDGCWEWMGAKAGRYGQFSFGKSGKAPAHRVSYEIAFGSIPKGLLVCHHCDNRICVRPSHLFVGTQSDNLNDMYAKGRR